MCSSSSSTTKDSKNNEKQTFAAVIFDRCAVKKAMEDESNNLREPLLTAVSICDDNKDNSAELDPATVKQIKICCLIFGVLIGFFMQISSIGANFLTTIPWSHIIHAVRDNTNASEHTTAYDYTQDSHKRIFYSVLWTVVTVSATGVIIMVVRYLFETTFNLRLNGLRFSSSRRESVLEEMIHYFECYFSLGVLIAVTIGWFGVAYILGMPTTLSDTIITLAFPVFWCWTFVLIFTSKPETITTATNDCSEAPIILV